MVSGIESRILRLPDLFSARNRNYEIRLKNRHAAIDSGLTEIRHQYASNVYNLLSPIVTSAIQARTFLKIPEPHTKIDVYIDPVYTKLGSIEGNWGIDPDNLYMYVDRVFFEDRAFIGPLSPTGLYSGFYRVKNGEIGKIEHNEVARLRQKKIIKLSTLSDVQLHFSRYLTGDELWVVSSSWSFQHF